MQLVFHTKQKRERGQKRVYHQSENVASRHNLSRFFLVFFVIGFVFLLKGLYGVFQVANVNCETEKGPCVDADQKLTQSFVGRLIFGSFSLHSPGKTYTIQKKYPHILNVRVDDIPILFVLFTDEEKAHPLAVSTDGVLYTDSAKVDSKASTSATLIDLTIAANTQSLSEEQLTIYTKLFEFANKNPIDVMRIKSREEIQLHTKPDLTAIVSSESIDSELHSLQLILSSPTIEQRPALIDLRFDHPVLRYL
ncbi:MAG: hypothetical protein ABI758_06880 [Candidatus Woesebacteria bacterium]